MSLLLLSYAPEPLAPTLIAPADDSIVTVTVPVDHEWQFNEAYAGQTQGEYALRRQRVVT